MTASTPGDGELGKVELIAAAPHDYTADAVRWALTIAWAEVRKLREQRDQASAEAVILREQLARTERYRDTWQARAMALLAEGRVITTREELDALNATCGDLWDTLPVLWSRGEDVPALLTQNDGGELWMRTVDGDWFDPSELIRHGSKLVILWSPPSPGEGQ